MRNAILMWMWQQLMAQRMTDLLRMGRQIPFNAVETATLRFVARLAATPTKETASI